MWATKPIASWPHSPSRTSSSAWALVGIRSSPRHGLSPVSRSGLLAWWVIAIGRVCGTAIGTEPMLDHAGHAEALDDLAHRAGEGLPAVVGLGPVQQEVRRAAAVAQQPDHQPRARRTPRSGRARTTSPAAGRGSRGTGRRRRSRPRGPPSPRPTRCCDRPGRGVAGVEEPVEDQHHRQARLTGLVELGHVVDDVHHGRVPGSRGGDPRAGAHRLGHGPAGCGACRRRSRRRGRSPSRPGTAPRCRR